MNRKMREIRTKIDEKINLAKSLTEDEANKDVAKAEAVLAEIERLEKEFLLEEKLFNLEKEKVLPEAIAAIDKKNQREQQNADKKAFALNVRKLAKGVMAGGVDEDGGYTVPEDISTKIRHYRDEEASLLDLVNVESVSTNTGSRTYQKKGNVDGFVETDEAGNISEIATPKYERLKWEVKDYTGFIPVTNQLINDSDENVEHEIVSWFGKNSRATANRLILGAIATKEAVAFNGLSGIKHALNVTLGQAYKPTSVIVTNDDGLDYLDNLVDANGRPILNPDPTAPAKLQLRVGATVIPLKVYSNSVIKTEGTKVPFIVGDLKEAVTYWDRQKMSILASQTASVGDINAFAQNLTLMRAIEREDVTPVDSDAFVNGYIDISAKQQTVTPDPSVTSEGE